MKPGATKRPRRSTTSVPLPDELADLGARADREHRRPADGEGLGEGPARLARPHPAARRRCGRPAAGLSPAAAATRERRRERPRRRGPSRDASWSSSVRRAGPSGARDERQHVHGRPGQEGRRLARSPRPRGRPRSAARAGGRSARPACGSSPAPRARARRRSARRRRPSATGSAACGCRRAAAARGMSRKPPSWGTARESGWRMSVVLRSPQVRSASGARRPSSARRAPRRAPRASSASQLAKRGSRRCAGRSVTSAHTGPSHRAVRRRARAEALRVAARARARGAGRGRRPLTRSRKARTIR